MLEHGRDARGTSVCGTAILAVTVHGQDARATSSDRGRESVIGAPPPSEPDRRISRIRLSSWWFYLRED
jgi:hypothetical protein